MKFTTLFALIATASAAGSANTQKMVLKDQMKSLQTMVQTAQTHKASDMVSAITDRKASLEYQLALAGNNADKKGIARELTYLLDLVKNIEQNDFEGATKTLAHRKNKLFKYQMHLADTADPADDAADDGSTDTADPAEGGSTDPADPADGAADTADDGSNDETVDPAAEGEAKSNTGAIIGGVAAAAVIVGGCVYMKKKNSEDAEGGQKEDKKLFKSTFKGNVVKKVQKEALVPTFAVPAEENI